MGALSKKLRSFAGGDHAGIAHWCPGCNKAHMIWTKNVHGRPVWTWNGDVDRPTTSPSVRCFTTYDDDHKKLPDGGQRTLCHYFLKDGRIEFCGDCEHELSGKTVDLPDFPDHWGGFD